MQVRAIIEAAIEVSDWGDEVIPEIMIPLINDFQELKILRSEALKL
jgi:pyruvate,orthophosphate dikinase